MTESADLRYVRNGVREAVLVLGTAAVSAGLASGGTAIDARPEPSEAVLHGSHSTIAHEDRCQRAKQG